MVSLCFVARREEAALGQRLETEMEILIEYSGQSGARHNLWVPDKGVLEESCA